MRRKNGIVVYPAIVSFNSFKTVEVEVSFPNFEYCSGYGATKEEALYQAEEALIDELYDLFQSTDILPDPVPFESINLRENQHLEAVPLFIHQKIQNIIKLRDFNALTRDEVLLIEPGKQLDVLVERVVFEKNVTDIHKIPNYSTSEEIAWSLIDFMRNKVGKFDVFSFEEIDEFQADCEEIGFLRASSMEEVVCKSAILFALWYPERLRENIISLSSKRKIPVEIS